MPTIKFIPQTQTHKHEHAHAQNICRPVHIHCKEHRALFKFWKIHKRIYIIIMLICWASFYMNNHHVSKFKVKIT